MTEGGAGGRAGGGDGRGRFAPVALRLAGLAGWHLGWSADQFWQATPAEMESIIRVMLGERDGGETAAAPSRESIARLQEKFPDG